MNATLLIRPAKGLESTPAARFLCHVGKVDPRAVERSGAIRRRFVVPRMREQLVRAAIETI